MRRKLVLKKRSCCIGCKLCVLAASRLSKGTISLSDSFITVSRSSNGFEIDIDYADKTDYEEILKICPGECFSVSEQ